MTEQDHAPIPTLKERMAALNLAQVSNGPSSTHATNGPVIRKNKPPPPAPPSRPLTLRADSVNNPPTLSHGIASSHTIGNQPARGGLKELLPPPALQRPVDRPESRPALPSRRPTSDASAASSPSPALPPRRPSAPSRKQSTESIASVVSNRSSMSVASTPRTSVGSAGNDGRSRMRAPDYDPASLPPLPERKASKAEEDAPGVSARPYRRTSLKPAPGVEQPASEDRPALPSRPQLPIRPKSTVPEQAPRRSALEWGMNKGTAQPPPLPTNRPGVSATPPPIPTASRPDLAALQASKPKPTTNNTHTPTKTDCCLKCRDFTAPDTHAARFPRQSIPSTDIGWLARELTAPFPSATDKARSLFKWLHHNVNYDVKSFFAGNIKPSTPGSTIATGLAVCEGFAALFAALALAAGLEAVVVTGHGKGYGYDPNNLPSSPDGHAWNAVRIDGGEWKLIDPCWGAGHIECEKKDPNRPYIPSFHPEQFTMTNDEFGRHHYPQDDRYFFRDDGRPSISFHQEYFAGDAVEPAQFYQVEKHSIKKESIVPQANRVPIHDPMDPHSTTLRISMHKICPHWDFERNGEGKPYLLLVKVNGEDGNTEEYLPVNFDGYNWWIDIPRKQLGRPGQDLWLYTQSTYNGQDGRGLTREEYYRTKKTWRSWGWAGVAKWTLV